MSIKDLIELEMKEVETNFANQVGYGKALSSGEKTGVMNTLALDDHCALDTHYAAWPRGQSLSNSLVPSKTQ